MTKVYIIGNIWLSNGNGYLKDRLQQLSVQHAQSLEFIKLEDGNNLKENAKVIFSISNLNELQKAKKFIAEKQITQYVLIHSSDFAINDDSTMSDDFPSKDCLTVDRENVDDNELLKINNYFITPDEIKKIWQEVIKNLSNPVLQSIENIDFAVKNHNPKASSTSKTILNELAKWLDKNKTTNDLLSHNELTQCIEAFQRQTKLILNNKFIKRTKKKLNEVSNQYPELIAAVEKYNLDDNTTLWEIFRITAAYPSNDLIRNLQSAIIKDLAFNSYKSLRDLKLGRKSFVAWREEILRESIFPEDSELSSLCLKIGELYKIIRDCEEIAHSAFREEKNSKLERQENEALSVIVEKNAPEKAKSDAQIQAQQIRAAAGDKIKPKKAQAIARFKQLKDEVQIWLGKNKNPTNPHLNIDHALITHFNTITEDNLFRKSALKKLATIHSHSEKMRHQINCYDENSKSSLDKVYLATKKWLEKRRQWIFPASSSKYYSIKDIHKRATEGLYIYGHETSYELAEFLILFEHKVRSLSETFHNQGIKKMVAIFDDKDALLKKGYQPDPVKTFMLAQKAARDRIHTFSNNFHHTFYKLSKGKIGRQNCIHNFYQQIHEADLLRSYNSDKPTLQKLQKHIEIKLGEEIQEENPNLNRRF